jgi:hypothetical protein
MSSVPSDLTAIARALRGQRKSAAETKMQLVLGDQHGVLMRLARENARSTILIGGDKLSSAAEAKTLIPMIAAAKRSVKPTICFSKNSGPLTDADGKELHRIAAAENIRLLQIRDRELHGKFLIWDDDHVVITSLNWSSADTRPDAPFGEIGLYLQASGLGAHLRARLERGWPALGH